MKATLAVVAGLLTQAVPAVCGEHLLRKRYGMKGQAAANIELIGNGTFEQQLDHDDPSKGTFKQRYWWDASNWGGKGSPVFLFNAGEDDASGYVYQDKNYEQG